MTVPRSVLLDEGETGGNHACAVRTDGAVCCWGTNALDAATPPPGPFTRVSAGDAHTCGYRSDGSGRAGCEEPSPEGSTNPDVNTHGVTVWRAATNVPAGVCRRVRKLDCGNGAQITCFERNNHEHHCHGDWNRRSAVPLIPSQEECGTNGRICPSSWLRTGSHNPLVAGSSPAGLTSGDAARAGPYEEVVGKPAIWPKPTGSGPQHPW